MLGTVYLKPAKSNIKVPLPESPRQYLPVDGKLVRDNQYWQRRLAAGEVIISKAPAVSQKKKEASVPSAKPEKTEKESTKS